MRLNSLFLPFIIVALARNSQAREHEGLRRSTLNTKVFNQNVDCAQRDGEESPDPFTCLKEFDSCFGQINSDNNIFNHDNGETGGKALTGLIDCIDKRTGCLISDLEASSQKAINCAENQSDQHILCELQKRRVHSATSKGCTDIKNACLKSGSESQEECREGNKSCLDEAVNQLNEGFENCTAKYAKQDSGDDAGNNPEQPNYGTSQNNLKNKSVDLGIAPVFMVGLGFICAVVFAEIYNRGCGCGSRQSMGR